jgi:hypothetical protein
VAVLVLLMSRTTLRAVAVALVERKKAQPQ